MLIKLPVAPQDDVPVTAKTLGQAWYTLRFPLFAYRVVDDIYFEAHGDQHHKHTSSRV